MKRILVCLLILFLVGCAGESDPTEEESVGEAATNTPVIEATPTSSPMPTATAAPTATPVPTETPTVEPTALPPTPTEVPPTPTPVPELLYSEDRVGGRAVHIYQPTDGQGPFPTLLFIGQRTPTQYARFAEAFQARGYAVVVLHVTVGRAGVEQSFCTLGWMNSEGADYDIDMAHVVTVGELVSGWIAETVALADDPTRFLANCDYTLPEDYRVSAGASWWATHLGRMEETALCMEWLPHQSSVGGWFGAIDVPVEEVAQLWNVLNETEPADWPTIETSAEPFLQVVPFLPTYWASGDDPPLWLAEPAKPASPWLCTSFFGADAEALGVDVTVAPIQLDREPCNEFPCCANLEGLTMPDHPVFPRIVNGLDAFLNELFGPES